jgi:hypothetical protein
VDCNGSIPNVWGCLLPSGATQEFSGQQGPDHDLEIFPSYNTPTANFILYAEMGAANYKGLENSTLNCNGSGATSGGYFWGSFSKMGPGVHVEGCGANNYFQIGNIPAGTGCNGADHFHFVDSDPTVVIQRCGSQSQMTFHNIGGGIVNNQLNAPVVNISAPDYYWDSGTLTAGPPGIDGGTYSIASILLTDPGQYFQVGYKGFHAYVGTPNSGWNAGNAGETASLNMRAYSCGNMYWDHPNTQWKLGGDGGLDGSCIFHLNGGALGLFAAKTIAGSVLSAATALTFTRAVMSGNGHFLIGTGWLDPTTGAPIAGEGLAATQIKGGISGDVQMAQGTGCSTTNTAGNICTSGQVTWGTPFASSSYYAVCSGIGITTGYPIMLGIGNQTSTYVTVQITNGQGSQAVVSTIQNINCWAAPNIIP